MLVRLLDTDYSTKRQLYSLILVKLYHFLTRKYFAANVLSELRVGGKNRFVYLSQTLSQTQVSYYGNTTNMSAHIVRHHLEIKTEQAK